MLRRVLDVRVILGDSPPQHNHLSVPGADWPYGVPGRDSRGGPVDLKASRPIDFVFITFYNLLGSFVRSPDKLSTR